MYLYRKRIDRQVFSICLNYWKVNSSQRPIDATNIEDKFSDESRWGNNEEKAKFARDGIQLNAFVLNTD